MRRQFLNGSQCLSVRFHGTGLFMLLVSVGAALFVFPANGSPVYRQPSVTEAMQLLASTNVDERLQAAYALALHSRTTDLTTHIPSMLPHLRDPSGAIRLNIAKALAFASTDVVAEEALQMLISFVSKPDAAEWQGPPVASGKWEIISCINIFGSLGIRAKASVPVLKSLSRSDDRNLALRAIETLGHIGTAESVTALFNALESTNEFVRGRANAALERNLVPSDEATCSVVIGRLESQDVRTRMLASTVLERAPRNLPPVIHALHKTVMNDVHAVQNVAVGALSRHTSPEAAAAMTDILEKNKNPHIRDRAASILHAFEMAPNIVSVPDIVPRLIRAHVAEDYSLARSEISRLLDSLGMWQWPTNCVRTVLPLLTNANPRIRSSAAFAIGGLGPKARDAIPALQDRLNDRDDFTRDKVRQALERIGPLSTGLDAVLVVLGGGPMDVSTGTVTPTIDMEARVKKAVAFQKEHTDTILLFTGGPTAGNTTVARMMADLAIAEGVSTDSIRLEDEARSLRLTALRSAEILRILAPHRVLIVGNDEHLDTAMPVFRRVDAFRAAEPLICQE